MITDILKKVLTFIALMGTLMGFSQDLEVEGTARITEMISDTSAVDLVLRKPDGSLVKRDFRELIIDYFLLLPNGIQTLLDAGECPLNLLAAGAVKSDLYGKTYQGGMIFYLDDLDTLSGIKGMVSAPSDQSTGTDWGCHGIDLPIPNVGPNPTGFGAEIGDGRTNTVGIDTSGCASGQNAAIICADLIINGYNDWFLPSILELNEMYLQIGPGAASALSNIGNFGNDGYWSSTEFSSLNSWYFFFETGVANFDCCFQKSDSVRVRAVRAF